MSLTNSKKGILKNTEDYIKSYFEYEGSGHDWWHIFRVRNMAVKIALKEGGDLFKIEMAALLHDLDDWKLHDNRGSSKILAWLGDNKLTGKERSEILKITEQVSFKGANVKNHADSLEAKIVQDADRLDAIGAIGIARTFAYGGSKGRLIYHPDVKPVLHSDFEVYKQNTAPTINHFYEKLLLLKENLNTETAKKIAEKRHQFMEEYLEQFYAEWEGKL